MHPSKHIKKTYRVTLHSEITDDHLIKLQSGIDIGGYITAPAQVKVILEEPERTILDITIHEGKNRQTRKMCEALSLDVARLKRVSVGGITLGHLPVGKWRILKNEELQKLMRKNP